MHLDMYTNCRKQHCASKKGRISLNWTKKWEEKTWTSDSAYIFPLQCCRNEKCFATFANFKSIKSRTCHSAVDLPLTSLFHIFKNRLSFVPAYLCLMSRCQCTQYHIHPTYRFQEQSCELPLKWYSKQVTGGYWKCSCREKESRRPSGNGRITILAPHAAQVSSVRITLTLKGRGGVWEPRIHVASSSNS